MTLIRPGANAVTRCGIDGTYSATGGAPAGEPPSHELDQRARGACLALTHTASSQADPCGSADSHVQVVVVVHERLDPARWARQASGGPDKHDVGAPRH